jgi:hypothetical protein
LHQSADYTPSPRGHEPREKAAKRIMRVKRQFEFEA